MDERTKQEILEKARSWMRDELIPAHRANTLKLASLKEFTVNPFLWPYLAYYLEGDKSYRTLAKVLVYPRALGSSITTSFGSRAQQLITRLFSDTFGSGIPGIDVEFIDKLDGRRKYCQIKAGPNVINRDDVTTIKNHFKDLKNLAKTNSLTDLRTTDMMFCLLYGEPDEQNAFVKEVEEEYVVVMGQAFWHRFTGDPDFYKDLVKSLEEVAIEVNMKETVEGVIDSLALDIQKEYGGLVDNEK